MLRRHRHRSDRRPVIRRGRLLSALNRTRGERGEAAVSFLVMAPLLLGVTFLILQWQAHESANQAAEGAAREAAMTAAAWTGDEASATKAAQQYLDSVGKDLRDPQVIVKMGATTVTVTVTGHTLELVPGVPRHVSVTETMPLEELGP